MSWRLYEMIKTRETKTQFKRQFGKVMVSEGQFEILKS